KKWKQKRAQEKAIDIAKLNFICICCKLSPTKKSSSFSNRWEVYESGFCYTCYSIIRDEKERRIAFVRSTVGKLVDNPGYRDNHGSSRWMMAKDLANTDPYRLKQYDEFISI
ncbi:hypothetical protein KA005_56645, partial [bacterium]|nr:hypothetical protein [bacterium]